MGGSTSGSSNIKPEKEYEIEEGGRDEQTGFESENCCLLVCFYQKKRL